MGPEDLLAKIYNSVDGGGMYNGDYMLPCDMTDAKVDFVLGGRTFSMTARNLVCVNSAENGQKISGC